MSTEAVAPATPEPTTAQAEGVSGKIPDEKTAEASRDEEARRARELNAFNAFWRRLNLGATSVSE